MRNIDGRVSTAEIQSSAVVTDSIATGAVVTNSIAAGAVVTNSIAAGAVVAATIAAGVVSEDKLVIPVSVAKNASRTAKFQYDFAVDGGAISSIALRGGPLPANSKIVGGRAYVVDALVSGGAAFAGVSLAAPDDIIAAVAVAGAPWSLNTTFIDIIPQGTFATDIAFPVGGSPTLDITAFVLTAGKFDLWLDYIVTD